MRPITLGSPPGNASTEAKIDWIIRSLRTIEGASKQGTEQIAHDFTITNLTERFDLDVSTATAAQIAQFLCTFLKSVQQRGIRRE